MGCRLPESAQTWALLTLSHQSKSNGKLLITVNEMDQFYGETSGFAVADGRTRAQFQIFFFFPLRDTI